jgi:hypothetical protein
MKNISKRLFERKIIRTLLIRFHFLYLKKNRFVTIEFRYHDTKRKQNVKSQPGKIKNISKSD